MCPFHTRPNIENGIPHNTKAKVCQALKQEVSFLTCPFVYTQSWKRDWNIPGQKEGMYLWKTKIDHWSTCFTNWHGKIANGRKEFWQSEANSSINTNFVQRICFTICPVLITYAYILPSTICTSFYSDVCEQWSVMKYSVLAERS